MAAGLFGLLALNDDIGRPWAMKWATVLAAAATGVSAFFGAWVPETTVEPARLDLVQARQASMFGMAVTRARIGLALLLAAVVLAIVATWPSGEAKSASVAIGQPTVVASAAAKRVTLTVMWSDLAGSVARVKSTISGSRGPATTPKAAGGDSVEQTLDTTVPLRLASVRVERRSPSMLRGRQVGLGYTKQVALAQPR